MREAAGPRRIEMAHDVGPAAKGAEGHAAADVFAKRGEVRPDAKLFLPAAAHTLAASFTIETSTLTAAAGPNGAIAPDGTVVKDFGTSQTFTITPDANYHVLDVLVDGVSVGPVTFGGSQRFARRIPAPG